jgi:predicted site-specific integrase-resolvase
MTLADTDELIYATEAAEILGVTLKHIYQSRWLGIGPLSSKRNGRIVFRRSDIEAYGERERARTLRGEGV